MPHLEKLRSLLSVGPRTLAQSAYLSIRYTDRVDSLVVHTNVPTRLHRNASIEVNANSRLVFGLRQGGASDPGMGRSMLRVDKNGRLLVPSGTAQIGPCSVLTVQGVFSMGNSYINSHCRIVCAESISIGNGCAIGWGVELLDDDRHAMLVDGKKQNRRAPIRIGDDVWIGRGVRILKGVTVGDGAVIASDSVVVRDVAARTLVAGHPAKVVREGVHWG